MTNFRKTVGKWAFLAAALFIACYEIPPEFYEDSCSADFRTVKIGNQTWMAENLNCDIQGSVCPGNRLVGCVKYGRLYDWNTAMKACPAGWHLPSDAEWTTLTDSVSTSKDGTKLKSKTGWNISNGVPVGTDEYGFSALPGGLGYSGGYFYGAGESGYWWSATEYSAANAWYRDMGYYYEGVSRNNNLKTFLHSVRCVKN